MMSASQIVADLEKLIFDKEKQVMPQVEQHTSNALYSMLDQQTVLCNIYPLQHVRLTVAMQFNSSIHIQSHEKYIWEKYSDTGLLNGTFDIRCLKSSSIYPVPFTDWQTVFLQHLTLIF